MREIEHKNTNCHVKKKEIFPRGFFRDIKNEACSGLEMILQVESRGRDLGEGEDLHVGHIPEEGDVLEVVAP